MIVFPQALPDTLRQGLLDLGKLILPLVLLFVLLGILLQSFLVLFRIIVVVDAHDAIERIGQRPVEGGSESRRFRFECLDGRSNFDKARPPADDGDGKLSISHHLVEAFAVCDIAYFKVVLHIALQEVPAVLADGAHDGVLGENKDAFAALLPTLTRSKTFPY